MYQQEIESIEKRIASLSARVVELEDKVAFLLIHEPASYAPVSSEERAGNEAAVAELLKRGNMLEAIRLYRENHQADLASAKKEVEELRDRLGY